MKTVLNSQYLKLAIFILTIVLVIAFTNIIGLDDYLNKQRLSEKSNELRSYVNDHYLMSVFIYITAYSVLTAVLPAAILMMLTGGLLYGPLWGTVFAIVGTMISATATFAFSRYFAGMWVQQKFEKQLEKFNRNFDKYGRLYLIGMRFVAFAPFCVLNLIAGLTKARLTTFMWTTFVGSLPGIFIFTFAGHSFYLF